MLELLSEGTAAILRQFIKGRPEELGHKPQNTQVIVAEDDSRLYLVNELGIVRHKADHVTESMAQVHTDTHVMMKLLINSTCYGENCMTCVLKSKAFVMKQTCVT